MLKSLTLAAVMVLGSLSLAHAADTAATAPMKQMHPHQRMINNSPCAPVFEACQKAGYNQGDMKDGKGLIANCIKPLDEGKSVAGVTIDKAKVDACKAHHLARKAEFDQKMKTDPEFAKKMQERKARWEARMNAAKAKAAPVATPTAPAAH